MEKCQAAVRAMTQNRYFTGGSFNVAVYQKYDCYNSCLLGHGINYQLKNTKFIAADSLGDSSERDNFWNMAMRLA